MTDLEELKRLAQAAQVSRDLIEGLHWQMATNPLAVLALIERVERAESDNGALLKYVSGRDCNEVFSGDDCIESNLSRKEMCLRCRVVSDPHPGAALLERIAALESALKEKP